MDQRDFSVLFRMMERIMADLSGLTSAVESLVASQATIVSAFADLAAKVTAAEAGAVPQADVDALTAQVQSVNAALVAAAAQADPQPVAAPEVPAAPAAE